VSGFEAFYDSPLQHPWLRWAAGVAGVAYALGRPGLPPEVRRYVQALGLLTLLDAWLTSNHVIGIGRLTGAAAAGVPLFFVLAGDLRYLLIVENGTASGRLRFTARGVARAGVLMLVVPLSSQLLVPLLAGPDADARVLFLVYEVSFFALTLALIALHPGAAPGRWPRAVSRFVLLYYGLWACADAIILATGSDFGFGLRVVPNVLYYGGLIAIIGRCAAIDAEAEATRVANAADERDARPAPNARDAG
jgi:hypothetical protein